MSDKIKQWRITWKDSTPTNTTILLGFNGNLGSAITMSYGMTLLALTSVYDETCPNALATLLVVHPIRLGERKDDYIAVVLNATMCHMELYTGVQDKGLHFPNGFANVDEDVIDAFKRVKAAMEQVNKERVEVASKPNKHARTKKNDAAVGAHEIGDKTTLLKSPLALNGKVLVTVESKRHPKQRSLMENYRLQLEFSKQITSHPKRSRHTWRLCTSPWRTAWDNAFRIDKALCPTKFLLQKSTLILILSNTAFLLRRERSKFNWGKKHWIQFGESLSYTAFRSKKHRCREGGQRRKGWAKLSSTCPQRI